MNAASLSGNLSSTDSLCDSDPQDTHDLFSTLIVSLDLQTHRTLFKTFPNTFTTDEAAENLSALKFSQSNRVPDPNEPNRVITTTTTTTFTMNRDMAKGICQHFMDARLIENAQDPGAMSFRDRGIYMLTPKGLHILERFITKNGINGEHLLKVFSSQPICMKLLHLERRHFDDELLVNGPVLEVIFRRFVGRYPNYPSRSAMYTIVDPNDPSGAPAGPVAPERDFTQDFDRTMGVEMMDVAERQRSGQLRVIKHAFSAMTALDWLQDFTTMAGRDEASEIAAHFERLELIELIADRPKPSKEAGKPDPTTVSVRSRDAQGVVTEGQFRCQAKAIYGLTDKGRTMARWEGYWQPAPTQDPLRTSGTMPRSSSDRFSQAGSDHDEARSIRSDHHYSGMPRSSDSPIGSEPNSRLGSTGDLHAVPMSESASYAGAKDSNTNRLRQILEEPALRSLFREFLKRSFCEENLSFWLDVEDFKRRFHTTSSAVAVRPSHEGKGGKDQSVASKMANMLRGTNDVSAANLTGYTAMEKHQQDLIAMAFVIYNTYLAPSSPCELNIEHNLRTELVTYVSKIVAEARSKTGSPSASDAMLVRSPDDLGLPSEMSPSGKAIPQMSLEDRKAASSMPKIAIHASQLQTMVRLYQRIQDHIFRLMATDSVPRFIKDPRFLSLVRSVEDYTKALESGEVDMSQHTGPG